MSLPEWLSQVRKAEDRGRCDAEVNSTCLRPHSLKTWRKFDALVFLMKRGTVSDEKRKIKKTVLVTGGAGIHWIKPYGTICWPIPRYEHPRIFDNLSRRGGLP